MKLEWSLYQRDDGVWICDPRGGFFCEGATPVEAVTNAWSEQKCAWVIELHEQIGLYFPECRKALDKCNNDFIKAAEFLRQRAEYV